MPARFEPNLFTTGAPLAAAFFFVELVVAPIWAVLLLLGAGLAFWMRPDRPFETAAFSQPRRTGWQQLREGRRTQSASQHISSRCSARSVHGPSAKWLIAIVLVGVLVARWSQR
jgi:hypothetical protein